MLKILVIVTNKYRVEAEYFTTAIIKHVFTHTRTHTHTKCPYVAMLMVKDASIILIHSKAYGKTSFPHHCYPFASPFVIQTWRGGGTENE